MLTYANGQIPGGSLVAISGGGSLLSGAAASWEQARARVRALHGWTPTPTDALSAYRSYATQERIFRERYTTAYLPGRPVKVWNGIRWYLRPGKVTAATPGTSNHGKGIAVDVTGLGGFGGTRYRQFANVASGLGWSNAEGRSIGEAWHWVYTGPAELTSGGPGSIGGSAPTSPDLVSPVPLKHEEPDMPDLIFQASGSSGVIEDGWSYIQQTNGTLRALTSQEFTARLYAFKAVTGKDYPVVPWAGSDLNNLAVACGLWEYTGSRQTGPIGLTGRIIGRNASYTPGSTYGNTNRDYPPTKHPL